MQWFLCWSFAFACSFGVRVVEADLLLSNTQAPTTTVLFEAGYEDVTGDFDGVSGARQLGFTASYFGTNVSQVYVSTNGSLLLSRPAVGFDLYFPQPNVKFDARIAPLFDDYYLFNGSPGRVIESVSSGSYYGITWENVSMNLDWPTAYEQSVQAIWFGQATTLNGFQFQKDDIAFSYRYDPQGEVNALIGLQKNSTSTFLPAFGSGEAGYVITSNPTNLPYPSAISVIPNANNFFLFRPNGSGAYTATLETTPLFTSVPEPSASLLLGLLSATALTIRFYQHQSKPHQKKALPV